MQTVAKVCSMVRDGTVVLASVVLVFGAAVARAQTPATPETAPPAATEPEAAEPEATEPEATESEATEPAAEELTGDEAAPETPPPDGAESAVVAPVEAEPAPPPPAQAAPPSKVASYVLWGLGGASLAVGAVYGVLALQAEKDFDDAPTYDGADKTETRAIVSDVALGAGLILAVTGTIFYFVKDGPRSEKAAAHKSTKQRLAGNELRVLPYVGARSGGGTLSLRF